MRVSFLEQIKERQAEDTGNLSPASHSQEVKIAQSALTTKTNAQTTPKPERPDYRKDREKIQQEALRILERASFRGDAAEANDFISRNHFSCNIEKLIKWFVRSGLFIQSRAPAPFSSERTTLVLKPKEQRCFFGKWAEDNKFWDL